MSEETEKVNRGASESVESAPECLLRDILWPRVVHSTEKVIEASPSDSLRVNR